MGNIGDTISAVIPAVGSAGPTYASNINLFLTEVKNRLEAKIPLSSLEEGDLDLQDNNIINAASIELVAGDVDAPTLGMLYADEDGDLTWESGSGPVQLTDGGTLNVALLGGISGDYGGANPAEFRFVDADQEFYAYDNYGTGTWAKVWARNFDIAAGASSAVRARLAFDGSLSQTYTLPASPPASWGVMQMDDTGAMTADSTVSGDLFFEESIESNSPYYFVNYDTLPLNVALTKDPVGSHSLGYSQVVIAASVNPLYMPISGLPPDAVITGFKVWLKKGTTSAHEIEFLISRSTNAGADDFPSGLTVASSANAIGNTTLEVLGQSHTVEAGYNYYLQVGPSGSVDSSADKLYHAQIYWTRPRP